MKFSYNVIHRLILLIYNIFHPSTFFIVFWVSKWSKSSQNTSPTPFTIQPKHFIWSEKSNDKMGKFFFSIIDYLGFIFVLKLSSISYI